VYLIDGNSKSNPSRHRNKIILYTVDFFNTNNQSRRRYYIQANSNDEFGEPRRVCCVLRVICFATFVFDFRKSTDFRVSPSPSPVSRARGLRGVGGTEGVIPFAKLEIPVPVYPYYFTLWTLWIGREDAGRMYLTVRACSTCRRAWTPGERLENWFSKLLGASYKRQGERIHPLFRPNFCASGAWAFTGTAGVKRTVSDGTRRWYYVVIVT